MSGRAIGLCVLLLLGTAGLLGTALIWQDYSAVRRAFVRHIVTNGHAVSLLAEPLLLLGDAAGLTRMLRVTGADETLRHGAVFDAKWQVRADAAYGATYEAEFEARPVRDAAGALIDVEVRRRDGSAPAVLVPEAPGLSTDIRLYEGSRQILAVTTVRASTSQIELDLIDGSAPSGTAQQAVGYVLLTHSLDRIHAELSERIRVGAVLTVCILLGSATVTFVAVRRLLLPLRELVDVTRAIAAGNRSKRASENAVGEIGALARSFNNMAGRLQETHESIERTVQVRTAELVRANRAKDDFLANMSHEIRTPMTAILGFAENLVDPQLSASEILNAVQTIRRNGDHLLQIINDILDLSKIEAGKLIIEHIPFSIVHAVEEVSSLMRARALAKDLQFKVEYDGLMLERIVGDPTRVRQILLNILGNAIKFTQRGGVRLVVRLRERVTPSDDRAPARASSDADFAEPAAGARPLGTPERRWLLEFEVIDTGVGMTPEQLERLFQPFTQADESMSRRFGGTGLGLVIVRRIATLMGGDVQVRSQFGVGTTLSVTLDAGPVGGATLIDPEKLLMRHDGADRPAVTATAELSNARVYLVEDGIDNQRLISQVLRKAGAEVSVTDNGKTAINDILEAARDGRAYDVVLMDMQMPEMDGYTATAILRRRGYTGVIIALTAHAMATDRAKCLNCGCDDYATKPIDRRKLLELLASYSADGRRTATVGGA